MSERPTNSKDYWKWRQARRMYEQMKDADKVGEDISRLYAAAARELQKETDKIFFKYQQKWGLSRKDAERLLEKVRGKKTIDVLKAMIPFVAEEVREEFRAQIESGAYAARIRRLERLGDTLDKVMASVYQQDEQIQRRHYVQFAEDEYYKGIWEVQKQVGFQFSFHEISEEAIDMVVNRAWSGMSFSENIWANTQKVADAVRDSLLMELMTGRRQEDAARELAARMSVGAMQSRRIIRTESNYISGQVQQQAYDECGAERYIYVATLDSRTDEECGRLDGTVHLVKNQMPGTNMHPMHPNCRCTTMIYIDEKTLAGLERRARNPETGKNEMVPANTTWSEWRKQNGLDKPKAKKKPAKKKTPKKASKPKKATKAPEAKKAPEKPQAKPAKAEPKPKKAELKKAEYVPDELDLRLQRDIYQKHIRNGKTPEQAERLTRNLWETKGYDKMKAQAMKTQEARDSLMESVVKSGKSREEAQRIVEDIDRKSREDYRKRSEAAKRGAAKRKNSK